MFKVFEVNEIDWKTECDGQRIIPSDRVEHEFVKRLSCGAIGYGSDIGRRLVFEPLRNHSFALRACISETPKDRIR